MSEVLDNIMRVEGVVLCIMVSLVSLVLSGLFFVRVLFYKLSTMAPLHKGHLVGNINPSVLIWLCLYPICLSAWVSFLYSWYLFVSLISLIVAGGWWDLKWPIYSWQFDVCFDIKFVDLSLSPFYGFTSKNVISLHLFHGWP